jgi:threonine/homoserine/homoserine lactone efflux protein
MSKHVKLFFAAFSISFIGALPVGTLSASVANYALNNNFSGAIQFGFAAILVEVVLVRVALIVFDRLTGLKKLFKCLSAVMCFAILILAYKTLEAAFHMRDFRDVLPFVGKNAFFSGLVLSFLNPLHLPFWMGWTVVLKNKKILANKTVAYNVYILAIGAGTCASFILYGVAGSLLINVLKEQHNLVNWVLGFTLLFTGLAIAYKLMVTPLHLKSKINLLREVKVNS